MRVIRASEIGAYLFCRRAWWYHLQGITPENEAEMAAGSSYHRGHGRRVLTAGLLKIAGWIFLLAALVVVAVALTRLALP